MGYGNYYWGLYRGYYRDPFLHNHGCSIDLLSQKSLHEKPFPRHPTIPNSVGVLGLNLYRAYGFGLRFRFRA